MKKLKLITGPLTALLLFLVTYVFREWSLSMSATVALFGWMAIWWITEAVSIYITSLLPILILPVSGVIPMEKVAPFYMSEIIFLFIGGFLLAYAMEKSGLHQRLALFILQLAPKSGNGILGGVMSASFIVSMFINNTATTAMLLPAVLGLNEELNKKIKGSRIAAPLLLGLAFSASIGGMATTIGTAPNLIFLSAYHDHFPNEPISFAKWLTFGLPIALLIQTFAYFILQTLYKKTLLEISVDDNFIQTEKLKIGKPSRDEKIITFSIVVLFFGWFLKDDIDLGFTSLHGWSNYFPNPKAIKESTLIMLMCLILYFIPSVSKKENLLSWNEFKRVPIGVIFLFGGGLALSKGIEESGLSNLFATKLEVLSNVPAWVFLILCVSAIALLSEFASNVATMNIVMAVIFSVLPQVDLQAQQVLIACAMAASIGYALPAATPPNSIVFGTEKIQTKEMINAGALLDVAAIIIVSLFCYFVVGYLF